MQYIFDMTLILVSGTACLYCWLLNRRIRNLQDMKSGLGASIASLNKAVTRTAAAAQDAKTSAANSAAQLSQLLREAEKWAPEIEELIDRIDRSSRSAAGDARRVQAALTDEIKEMSDQARQSAEQLLSVVELIQDHTGSLYRKYGDSTVSHGSGDAQTEGDHDSSIRIRARTASSATVAQRGRSNRSDGEDQSAFDNIHRIGRKAG